jgi:hypothetical protein
MATIRFRLCILVLFLFCSGWKSYAEEWLVEKHKGYTFYYSQDDRQNKAEYIKMVNKGIKEARSFFGDPYKSKFDVYIYHSREAMDKQWQLDWKMPDLKSECWMVASGVAHRLDVLSPKVWDKEACEHNYDDKQSTQEIFTHELVHVYHGQLNKSHDFSDVDRIDWFVEGLANFASGQCDEKTLQKIKLALTDNKIPESLDNFWTGNLRYGLSGSMVMYIDQAYGRKKLKELLKFNKKDEILSSLNVTETDLINGWKKMIGDITFPE